MAVKGAIIGDILGSPYEFRRIRDYDWKTVPLTRNPAARFTDDTVMTLAIKKAILEGLDLTETMVEVGRRYPNCGYGESFYNWVNGDDHTPYGSYGNGSAMRVAFIGEYFDDYDEMQRMAEASAVVSHNHPEGIKGAVVTATCIWMTRHGKSKQEIYDYVLSEYPPESYEYSVAYSLEELRPRYKWNETCQGSVPVAMRCFFESTDYESFMRNVISLNCDTDTFGAIAGGVAEEFYHGFGELDAEKILEKCLDDYLNMILNK